MPLEKLESKARKEQERQEQQKKELNSVCLCKVRIDKKKFINNKFYIVKCMHMYEGEIDIGN